MDIQTSDKYPKFIRVSDEKHVVWIRRDSIEAIEGSDQHAAKLSIASGNFIYNFSCESRKEAVETAMIIMEKLHAKI